MPVFILLFLKGKIISPFSLSQIHAKNGPDFPKKRHPLRKQGFMLESEQEVAQDAHLF
ncbi:hypothetical protein [Dickeya ananatis]|uniref:hypothetical protein n=1 Tax=Dickeya ananatis TaxID=3061286 RepID=UPI00388D847D